jgi:hypothetical protein
MAKLNQIIAVEKGIKSSSHSAISELYKLVQKPVLFNGFSKTFAANDEDGEKLPQEQLRVQMTSDDALRGLSRSLRDLIQVTARKDYSNCEAAADVVVDGAVIVSNAPVPFLIFLEKRLVDIHSFIKALPTLDPAESWDKDPNSGLYRTPTTQTHRTKKTVKPIVKYPATPEHPAQTEMVTEDVITGYWSQVKMSGAMPSPDKEALLAAVVKLGQAVKTAREKANMADEVKVPDIGAAIFNYLLPTIKE